MVHLRNNEKRLSIDEENQFFHFKVAFLNLRHLKLCLAISKQYFRLDLLLQNTQASFIM